MQESPESTRYLTPEYLRKHHWRLPDDEDRRERLLAETEDFFDELIARAADSLGKEGQAETISLTVTVKAYAAADCLCFCPDRATTTTGCKRPCVHVPW